MGLKLKRFTKGTWCAYPGAEGVEFLIRPLQLSDGLAIRSKLRKGVVVDRVDPKTQKPFPMMMDDLDLGAFSWESFDFMLIDFRGPISIEMDDGTEVSFHDQVITKEESERIKMEIKKALFDDEAVRDFVAERAEFLRMHGEKKLEEEQGNSPSSQSGL